MGGTAQNALKGVGNSREGRENKDFKKGRGKLGQGVGALKRGEGLEPTYELWGPNLALRLGFLPFSQVWFISFLLNCKLYRMIAWTKNNI